MERYLKSRYKIGDQISENPFSITYRGAFMGTNKPVIIKIYKRGTLNSNLIKRMKQKVRELSLITHHGFAKLLDGDYGWQGFYYVREYVDGPSVKDLLAAKEEFGVEKAIAITCEVCQALEQAHQRGIIHGALKPSNIFIDQNGVVKVADFVIEGEIMEAMPQKPLMIMENGHYASPEELVGIAATEASDIYSLGMVLAEMVGLNNEALSAKGLTISLNKLRRRNMLDKEQVAALPKYLQDVVGQVLQADPLLRLSSASDLRQSLENRSLIRRHKENEEFLKIFENTLDEFGSDEKIQGNESLEDLGRIRIRWNLEKHRNWILVMVLAGAIISGLFYSFFLGR